MARQEGFCCRVDNQGRTPNCQIADIGSLDVKFTL
jgi:hypothetical protein